ncbi:MAG: ferrous iron transport protein A [Erysipelotrichales bacterium]|nr:ferrous iron transport protein A [Erysipelotrichales bacterium]
MKKLSEIEINKKVKILKLESTGKYRIRQMEMGIIPGTMVEIIKVSPLNDPITISLRGYQLTMRKSELDLILVEENA